MRVALWHRRLGYWASVPIALVAISGIGLGLQPLLRHQAFPWRVQPCAGVPMDSAAALRGMEERGLTRGAAVIHLPADGCHSYQIRGANSAMSVFLHPADGRVIARHDGIEERLWEWLYQFHRGKVAGPAGQIVVSLLAGVLVFLLFSAGSMAWRCRRVKRRGALLWHRRSGIALAVPLLIITISGGLLNYYGALTSLLDPLPLTEQPQSPDPALWERANVAIRGLSSARLESIYLPKTSKAPYLFYFSDGGRAYVDPANTRVIKFRGPATHWTGALFAIHSGKIVGSRGGLIPVASGLGLFLLIFSGLRLGRAARSRQASIL